VIVECERYSVAFAIHAGHTARRFHYVSFERSMVLDAGAAGFIAKQPPAGGVPGPAEACSIQAKVVRPNETRWKRGATNHQP
jgi:hypothetical protein